MSDNKTFVDTNIWLYAFVRTDAERDKNRAAAALIKKHLIVISSQIINEVCVNLIKKTRMDETAIAALISSFYQRYEVVEPNREIILDASRLRDRYQFSFWDSLLVASAIHAGAKRFCTEDMQDGLVVDGKLRITNPL